MQKIGSNLKKPETGEQKVQEGTQEEPKQATPQDTTGNAKETKGEQPKEPQGGEAPKEEPKQPEIKDETIFEILSNKLNKEVKSFDDLIEEKERVVEKEPEWKDEYWKKAYEFQKETNRPIEDFIFVQKDFDSMDSDQLAKSYLAEQNGLSNDDAKFEYEEDYAELPVPEDAEDSEKASIQRQNRKRAIERKKLQNQAKQHYKELQQKYKAPAKSNTEAIQEASAKADQEFSQRFAKAASEVNELEFNDFKYQLNESKLKSAKSLQDVFNVFKNEGGEFDYNKFYKTLEAGLNSSDIVKSVADKSYEQGKEEIINQKRNVGDQQTSQEKKQEVSDYHRQKMDEILGRGKRKINI